MSPDIAPCTNEFGRDRLAAGEAFLEAAETIALDDEQIVTGASRFKNNAVVSNYVHAGIAASDAICCFDLKAYSRGDDHRQAITQLRKVKGGGELSKALSTLLALKTKSAYGNKPLPDNDVKRAERAANKLVQAARERRP